MPGRKPKPTSMKILQGNPGKRPLNNSEPQFSGLPKCPSWLAKDAKREWKRVTAELAHVGLLKSTDQAALAAYCVAYGRWQTAEAIVTAEGQTVREPIVSKDGAVLGYKTKRHPATIIARDERHSMRASASLFGFDPSSRSRLVVADAAPADPFEEFMRGISVEVQDEIPAE